MRETDVRISGASGSDGGAPRRLSIDKSADMDRACMPYVHVVHLLSVLFPPPFPFTLPASLNQVAAKNPKQLRRTPSQLFRPRDEIVEYVREEVACYC
jgi:hypothetical protein